VIGVSESLCGALREDLIEQQINNYTSNGDVHPEWPGPARDSLVPFEVAFKATGEAHENHRHDDDGQDGVGPEDEQVDGPEPGWIDEARWTAVQVVRDVAVVSDVTNQKKSRRDECRDHAVAMRILPLFANLDVAGQKKDAAQAVQAGIHDR